MLMGLSSILLLAGCSEEAKTMNQLEEEVLALTEENATLSAQASGMAVTEESTETSLRTIEGSAIPEFTTIDGKIKFPNSLNVPLSVDDVNNSNVTVGSMFHFTPSTNWLMQMDGATLHFTHPSKVWGDIKAIGVDEGVLEEDMQPILQSFFTDFPTTSIKYRKIYMDETVNGMLARAEITVDKKPHVVNVGFVTRGEYGVLFLFDYEDNKTGVQQELVDLLLSSGSYGDTRIKLE